MKPDHPETLKLETGRLGQTFPRGGLMLMLLLLLLLLLLLKNSSTDSDGFVNFFCLDFPGFLGLRFPCAITGESGAAMAGPIRSHAAPIDGAGGT